jgi:hypothetical protein
MRFENAIFFSFHILTYQPYLIALVLVGRPVYPIYTYTMLVFDSVDIRANYT